MTVTTGLGTSDTRVSDHSRGCRRQKPRTFYADMFINLVLFPSRIQYAGINKFTSMCSIHLLLIVLVNALFPTISGFELRDTDKKILSTCDLELERCPMDSDSVDIRRLCMNNFKGCETGTSYLCGVDTSKTYIVEECQPDFSCPQGTSFQYVVTLTASQPKAHLQCVPCDGDRFEPEVTNSSLTSITTGCTYVHVPPDNLSSHLVLFERGTTSKATIYTCDYENNFYERNGIVFIDDVPTRSYECIQRFCPVGALLRPDGRCISCRTKLVPEHNFICYDPLWKKSQGTSSKTNTNAHLGMSPEKDDAEFPVVLVVILPVIGLASISVGVVCFVLRRRRRRASGNVYDRANANDPPENPPVEPLDNNNEADEHKLETPCTNTNHFSPHITNSTIGTNVQGNNYYCCQFFCNGKAETIEENAMPETADNHVSPEVKDEESLKPHLKMNHLNFRTSLDDFKSESL